MYFLHLSIRAAISSGHSEVKSICWPVVGCTKPKVLACSTCRGQSLKQFWI